MARRKSKPVKRTPLRRLKLVKPVNKLDHFWSNLTAVNRLDLVLGVVNFVPYLRLLLVLDKAAPSAFYVGTFLWSIHKHEVVRDLMTTKKSR